MKLIQENPYRIIGVVANSSARDLLKQKNKISAFAKVGKAITSEYDFPFLAPIERKESNIAQAFSNIEQNPNKVRHSLFWFINVNPIDNIAIQHLINGNEEKAIEIWEKVIDDKEVSERNFSAFNNLGTLYLLDHSYSKVKEGVSAKVKLIESDSFKDFVLAVADETYSIDRTESLQFIVDEVLKVWKDKLSPRQFLGLFPEDNSITHNYITDILSATPSAYIENQISQTSKKRNKNNLLAARYGNELYLNTKSNVNILKSLLGSNDLQYKLLTDNLAKEILQCSIDFFNESQERDSNGDYLEEAMKLAKIAQSVAVNPITRDRIEENMKTLEGMKDKELNQAIAFLKMIKKAFEQNKSEMEAKVKREELFLPFGQTINWTKVNQIINDSIKWSKVVEEIKEIVPSRNINKIKECSDSNKINEYKSLVNFLLSKLNSSLRREVEYLKYWEIQKKTTTSNSSTAAPRTTSSTTTSRPTNSSQEGIPDWLKWIGGLILLIILIRACE